MPDQRREVVSAILRAWLVFVRTICVEWLAYGTFARVELREICLGALLGALDSAANPGRPKSG